jgi:hypothetical protein
MRRLCDVGWADSKNVTGQGVEMKSVMGRLLPIAVMIAALVACEGLRGADADSPSVTELTIEQAMELAGRQSDLELSQLRVLLL